MEDARTLKILRFIGANVRQWRHERGLTQEGLANEAEIDLTYLQRVERASVNISVAVLVRLADALGIEIVALFAPAKMAVRKAGRPKGR